MTQLEIARKGNISREMELVARYEGLEAEFIQEGIKQGTIVIPANVNHTNLTPRGIGHGLKTKVNANIGTSSAIDDIESELEKLRIAVEAGADAVMDLSTGSDIAGARKAVMAACPLPVGTVPFIRPELRPYPNAALSLR